MDRTEHDRSIISSLPIVPQYLWKREGIEEHAPPWASVTLPLTSSVRNPRIMGRAQAPAEKKAMATYTDSSVRADPGWKIREGNEMRREREGSEMERNGRSIGSREEEVQERILSKVKELHEKLKSRWNFNSTNHSQ
jgi:hypothetical protein